MIALNDQHPDADLSLKFSEGKTIEGLALDPNNKPLPNGEMKLTFRLADGHQFGLTPVYTDEHGRFEIHDATPEVGTYAVEPNIPGVMAKITELDFRAKQFTLLCQRGRRLTGRVVEAGTGYIVPHLQVRAAAVNENNMPMLTGETDGNGRFEFTTLSPAQYTFYMDECQKVGNETYEANSREEIRLEVKLYERSKAKPHAP